jgi:hypothetical protein
MDIDTALEFLGQNASGENLTANDATATAAGVGEPTDPE